jgi:hypothetical protein
MTPLYRAQCVVSPAQADSLNGGGLARLAGQFGALGGIVSDLGLGGSGDNSQLWMATLRSRNAVEAFVRERNLMPILFDDRWDAAAKTWKTRNGKSREPTMGDAVIRMRRILAIDEDKRTGLITVAFKWRDREQAAEWANAFVAMVNAMARARIIDEARRSMVYLEAELDKTNVVERRQIIFRLIESKVNDVMLAQGRTDYAFAVVDPAVAPDANKPFSPRRLVFLALGLFAGCVAAGVVVFIAAARSASRGARTSEA